MGCGQNIGGSLGPAGLKTHFDCEARGRVIFVAMSNPSTIPSGRDAFPFERRNYVFFLAGIALLVVGYLLMSGGGVEDPNEFSEEIFSVRRITVAPLMVMLGYGVIFFSILKRFPAEGEQA